MGTVSCALGIRPPPPPTSCLSYVSSSEGLCRFSRRRLSCQVLKTHAITSHCRRFTYGFDGKQLRRISCFSTCTSDGFSYFHMIRVKAPNTIQLFTEGILVELQCYTRARATLTFPEGCWVFMNGPGCLVLVFQIIKKNICGDLVFLGVSEVFKLLIPPPLSPSSPHSSFPSLREMSYNFLSGKSELFPCVPGLVIERETCGGKLDHLSWWK